MKKRKFASSKDVVFKLFILFVSFTFIIGSILLFILVMQNKFHDVFAIMFLLFSGLIGVLVWYGLNYSIRDKILDISIFSLVIYSINISQIISISKKRTGTYIYGLSNDTISLNINNKEINISPTNAKDLIKELIKINPRILLVDI